MLRAGPIHKEAKPFQSRAEVDAVGEELGPFGSIASPKSAPASVRPSGLFSGAQTFSFIRPDGKTRPVPLGAA